MESSGQPCQVKVGIIFDASKQANVWFGSIHLATAIQRKGGAFQGTSQNTYCNRAHTNTYVIQKANLEINRNRMNGNIHVKFLSELMLEGRVG